MKFSHAGQIGDIIASFWLVRALTADPVDFCIVTEQKSPYAIPDDTWHNGSMITRKSAQALAPLLRSQSWIRSVEIREDYPADSLHLDLWRRFPLNLAAGDLREFPFQTVSAVLPREFWKPVLQAEKSSQSSGRIIVMRTERYLSLNVDWSALAPWGDRILFLGLQAEHAAFEKAIGRPVEYRPTSDFLELAGLVAGCDLFVANPSGGWWVAEALKVRRLAVTPDVIRCGGAAVPGPVNSLPFGGVCASVSTTGKLKASLEFLLGPLVHK